jgi:HK97 family phage major capsid protein
VQNEFNRQEGIAFVSGDGVNKPSGFLTYVAGGVNAAAHPGGSIDVVDVDIDPAAPAATVDGLIDFMYGLEAPYRQNATWLMSSLTAAVLAKLKDANGNLIWRESLLVGQPSTLLGRPVEIDEGMPAPGVVGNLPVAFGDFRAGYLINDRIGTRVLRDPYTNKPYVMFYVTKRVGGGVLDPNAIRVLRVPA